MGGGDSAPTTLPTTSFSSSTIANADDVDDDESFRKLVGVGDNLTLEERVTRALDSGDDVKALKALRQATEYFVCLGDAVNVVNYATRFRRHAETCYEQLDAATGSGKDGDSEEKRMKIIVGFYVKAIQLFVDEALPRIQGQSGQDLIDAQQHAAFLAHAADLRDDDALEAATRCANWLEIGRVRRPIHSGAAFDVDVLVDRASARDYRLRVREILRGRGRDVGGDGGDGDHVDCSICLDVMEMESCGGETIRILPKCYHMFHEDCVLPFQDAEAKVITCPICKQENHAL